MGNVKDTDIVCFTDGGTGATVEIPGDEKIIMKEPCGVICPTLEEDEIRGSTNNN